MRLLEGGAKIDFEFRYRVTYADGSVIKSNGYGIIPISKAVYKLIVKNAIDGIPIAEIKGILSILARIKDHAIYMSNRRAAGLSIQHLPVSKIEFFSPEGDLERLRKYSIPYAVIDHPTDSMNIYRSDGSCVTISCDNGLVRVNDYGNEGAFFMYDIDEFAKRIVEGRSES